MDSINNLLLSIFAKNDRFNNQIDSLRRRFQTLTLIYINLLLIIFAILFSSVMSFISHSLQSYLLMFIIVPLLLINLILIRTQRLQATNMMLVIIMHSATFLVSHVFQWPLVCISGMTLYPYVLLFSASSLKIITFNSILCLGQCTYNAQKAYQMFQTTINEEQEQQLMLYISGSMFMMTCISLLAGFQGILDRSVWRLAQENYHKSENLNKEVLIAMEAKDRFISMVSHEIRNPLNTLKGSVDYLMHVVKDTEYMKILKSAKLSGEILLNLVNNVLDAAKLKSDKMEISNIETNSIDIIKKVFTVNSELLKDKELFAKAYIDGKLPPVLWIDSSRIIQILMNLVSNAIKFTPVKGKIELSIAWLSLNEDKKELLAPITPGLSSRICHTLPATSSSPGLRNPTPQKTGSESTILETQEMSFLEQKRFMSKLNLVPTYQIKTLEDVVNPSFFQAKANNDPWRIYRTVLSPQKRHFEDEEDEELSHKGYLKVQVKDSGTGISRADMARLFGMFEQGNEHSRSVHGGSGLGLWICKQLCQKMNGDITVYSEQGQGSTFVFYLPVDNDRINQGNTRVKEGAKKKMRVLVVDDFQTNRYLHRLLLEQEGVQVITAGNGKEAVEKYQEEGERFNFILMDVHMPVMDGFVASKEIREWEKKNRRKPVEIYFVTGEYFNEGDVLMRFRNMGGSGSGIKYLQKPLDSEKLKKIVKSYQ